ncbi:hypothetical protein ACW7G2_01995 [Luteimonas sp. A277]
MTPEQTDALAVALLVAVVIFTVPASFRLMHAIADGRPLWEPQWKREAREFSRYVPTADEWGR